MTVVVIMPPQAPCPAVGGNLSHRCAALFSILGGIAALIAAVCWFWSSRIEVPANQDTFIDVLQRIGYWNNKAALAACVAALLQGASLLL
jgi:hypothetical protein